MRPSAVTPAPRGLLGPSQLGPRGEVAEEVCGLQGLSLGWHQMVQWAEAGGVSRPLGLASFYHFINENEGS